MTRRSKYSWWQDFTEEEREAIKRKALERHQSIKEVLYYLGHPRDWEDNKPHQLGLFGDRHDR